MSRDKDNKETRIYVGNLPPDIRTKDIEDLFHKYGKIVFLDLKNRKGPPFAFLEFEDARFVFEKWSILLNWDFLDLWGFIFKGLHHLATPGVIYQHSGSTWGLYVTQTNVL